MDVSQLLLVVAVALTVGAIVFGIIVLITGDDGGLSAAEPDGAAVPLPGDRPLVEPDVAATRFDVAVRGYRMRQVDAAMRRVAYDIGYKEELIKVLQAEVDALRERRSSDAEVLRRAREAAIAPAAGATDLAAAPTGRDGPPAPRAPEPPAESPDAAPPERPDSAEPSDSVEPAAPAEPVESAEPVEAPDGDDAVASAAEPTTPGRR